MFPRGINTILCENIKNFSILFTCVHIKAGDFMDEFGAQFTMLKMWIEIKIQASRIWINRFTNPISNVRNMLSLSVHLTQYYCCVFMAITINWALVSNKMSNDIISMRSSFKHVHLFSKHRTIPYLFTINSIDRLSSFSVAGKNSFPPKITNEAHDSCHFNEPTGIFLFSIIARSLKKKSYINTTSIWM